MSPDWWRDCRDGIEKCSSPTGDGNAEEKPIDIEAMIEKCSSPTGDGNHDLFLCIIDRKQVIEKCSSPTGDGNNNLSPLQFQNYH